MTVYAEVQGTNLIRFPYTQGSLQEENPYTNYGNNPDIVSIFPQTQTAITNGYTLAPVTYLPQPSYDPSSQVCVQDTQPILVNNVWVIDWVVSPMTPEQKSQWEAQQMANNKAQASALLSATDWTSIPDVANPSVSNPYLMNQSEFLSWRSQVRAIAVNPPTTPATFPTQPTEKWSS